ncbi:MAG: type VI secretion system contractile sheath protein TssC [Bacteroidota bacterium]|nr:type VI secretion system contractile sheath protein TssC [Bacteroidota bacterium]
MAENELNKSEELKYAQYKELSDSPKEALSGSLDSLTAFGGFDFLEAVVDNVQNMNPERKARKNIFLGESSKKKERENLKDTLGVWIGILSDADSITEMVESCEKQSEAANKTLKKNVKKALEESSDLEKSYRSLNLFFSNTEMDKLKNLSIMNADMEFLQDMDDTRKFLSTAQEELVSCYDRLDLRDNYGLMVIPGYLGSNMAIEKWSKMAFANKVMLITDYRHLENPDDVIEMFEEENMTSGDIHKANAIMTCNYLVGREKEEQFGEEEELFVPPSGAYAGKIYSTLMSQVTAGKKHGGINDVAGVKFPLKRGEIANMEKIGLVPMVNEYGKVMAFSAKTLFNGDNLGLQTYSVVRVFDYVTKVLMDFLNRRAFENFTSKTRKDLQRQIIQFLDSITGPDKLIEKFKILKLDKDPNQPDKIFVDIHMTPYFPAKNFIIKMDGEKGDDGTEWNSEYEQE